MRVPLNIAQARDEIIICVRPTDFPTLEDKEIELLVRKSKRQDINRAVPDNYETWRANTDYSVGATIVSDPRNGSFFTCTVGGTSGSMQPTWPTSGNVTDNEVIWTRSGAAIWTPTWNLAYGIAFGWKLKMGRVACAVDISAAGQSIKRSQMQDQLKEMRKEWAMRASSWDQVLLKGSLRDR